MPTMTGQHVMLREYRQDDYPHIRKWVNDRNTSQYLSAIFWFPQTEADTTDFLNRAMRAAPNAAYFVIADIKDESYIGQLDLFEINWKTRVGKIGTVIGSEDKRGKGYGSEAMKLMLDYAFGILGLERVELEVYAENKRAVRCYEKAGFVYEGTRRHAAMVNGKHADVNMMSVLKADWENSIKAQ
ncbi:MAG TPA: GNAT family protein [Candidatus Limiplasma sp.]|nr:GNAT family protein [Candidatus Limiplasma sp.]